MKKKLLTVFFAIVAALCLCFGLAACGESGGTNPEPDGGGEVTHTHTASHFQADGGEHWKVCAECGEKFSVGEHDFNTGNTCKICGYSTVFTKGLAYTLNATGTYTVTGLGEAKGTSDLIIPAYYEGKAVTSIGGSAFYGCVGLGSVTIGGCVTSVGSYAFSGSTWLTNIGIPGSVTEIGEFAFENCTALQAVHITDLSSWCKIDFSNYAANPLHNAHHLHLDNVEVKDLTIPAEITEIKNGAFYGCSGLTSVTIGSGVTSVGEYAFCNCSGLTSVTIGSDVTSIGYCAFQNCSGLTNIIIPDSVASIERGAFWGTAYYSKTSNWENGTVLYIGNHLIEAHRLKSSAYIIRNGTKTIADDAFWQHEELASIVIPNSVTSIGSSAFGGCSGLKWVTIGKGVISIGEYAFGGCRELISIEIPDSVTSIGDSVFEDCSGLTSVTIGSGVTSIGEAAFYGCSGLEAVYYKGTPSEWDGIQIDNTNNYNSAFIGVARYYYSDQAPSVEQWAESPNWWHYYGDGRTIILWTIEE